MELQAEQLTEDRCGQLRGQIDERGVAGQTDGNAEQLARSITGPDARARALTGLAQAQALAGAGEHDRAVRVAVDAEQIARTITNPDMQAQVLTSLARASGLGRARPLIAAALAVGRWTVALRELARVDAAALSVFVDECAPHRQRGIAG
ncbi:hypothetical protein ACTOB_003617 [Actinoplanes oblitus]|uniref:Uncharacterized protein n=1 Tax=Actinoplanes oblitus TaxID=3040509 RepID=A0ABY8WR75_9ACTN|nr:hypothetical protein [Actinoplanes oblitus]WIM99947.1 hypothetical protein ACTOB_003617 [Actinoplanes oblitus]